MEIQLLISGGKQPGNHDQGRKETSAPAPIPSSLRTDKAKMSMGASLQNILAWVEFSSMECQNHRVAEVGGHL